MRIIGVDTETSLVLPGNICPPLACLTWAERVSDEDVDRHLLDRVDGVLWFEAILQDKDVTSRWQNGPYDWAVLVQEASRQYGDARAAELLELVFAALWEGRLSDIETREKLLLNERGLLFGVGDDDEARGIPLYELVKNHLNIDIREDKKNPDACRLRYGEMIPVPLELWPVGFVRYAEDDSVYNVLVGESQQRMCEKTEYEDPRLPWLVTDERRQVLKKWALHLMSAWGVRTDPERVPILTKRVKEKVREIEELILEEGLGHMVTKKGVVAVSMKRRAVQDRVRAAYDAKYIRSRGITVDSKELLLPDGGKELESTYIQRVQGCAFTLEDQDQFSDHGLPAIWPDKKAKAKEGHEDWEALLEQHGPPDEKGWVHYKVPNVKPEGGAVATEVDGRVITPTTDPSGRFPEGQVSWSRDVMAQSEDTALVAYGEQSSILKIDGTYIPILAHGMRYPICPQYDELKKTGRTSCKRPNMQNLPTFGGVRECFVARDGWVLLDADIDQAECAAWAQWCYEVFRFSSMMDAINEGKDPHLWLAIHFPELAGVTYEEALTRKKTGDKVVKRCRQFSKIGNFGRMGGMGAETLMEYARGYGIEVSFEEAQQIIEAFDEAWPESAMAQKWVGSRVRNDVQFTFVQPLSGRRRGGCGYTDGRNQPFQGRIADLAGDVMVRVALECYLGRTTHEDWRVEWLGLIHDPSLDTEQFLVREGILSPLYGARQWSHVHDEFILEIPYQRWGRERSHLAACRLEDIITERGKFWCPDVAIRSQSAMARRWIKDRKAGTEFERVLDANGYVIPMEEKETAA